MGDLELELVISFNHSCDAGLGREDPLFSGNHFLSGAAYGRDRLIRAQSGLGWHWKDRDNPERISGEFLETSQIHNRGSFWAQKPSSMLIQLPTVIVDEFLDRLPLGTAELNGWISKIDQTGYLNVVRYPDDLLDFRLSTGRSGPVNG